MTSATQVSLPLYVSHVVWMGAARPRDVHQLRCRTWALLWVHAASTCKFLRNLRPELKIVLWLCTPTRNKPKFFFPFHSPQHVVIKKVPTGSCWGGACHQAWEALGSRRQRARNRTAESTMLTSHGGEVKHWVNIHRALRIVPAK